MTSTLLIGIGNVLYADEGIGVHFVNYIQDKYQFYHPNITLDLLDGGTLAQGLIPILCRYDNLIVVDTVNSPGVQPGEVYSFNFDQAPPEIDWQGSAHEVEMLQTLIMMEMVGDRPNTHVIGVTPTVIEPMTLGLTPQIQAAVPVMEQALLKHLSLQGFSSKCIAEVDINSLIPDSYKRGANMYA